MPNKNYIRGVRFEREIINLFKDNGFTAVRTAGSHSPYDVIVTKESEQSKKICFVFFVQCKIKKKL
jgi:Holliday junction resolvase|tara:strand:+ start:8350 stop:8547 length:198 start_codon:yes stop_codon:yes gene_type:complete